MQYAFIRSAALCCAVASGSWLSGCGGSDAAQARTTPPTLTVLTLIDILPDVVVAGNEASAQALLNTYLNGVRGGVESGFRSIDLLQQEVGGNHFVMVEEWTTQADFDKHSVQPATKAFRSTLKGLLGSPFDQRFTQ